MLQCTHLAIGLLAIWCGCKNVPDVPEGPFCTVSYDTVVQYKQLIIPGDTLIFFADYASNTPVNHLHIKSFRYPLSTQFDFFGPDSDWHFVQQVLLSHALKTNAFFKTTIPEGLRPGLYQWKAWLENANHKPSDTSRFQFVITGLGYSTLGFTTPSNPSVATKLINKDAIPPDSARLAVFVPGYQFANLRLQWFDSLRISPTSDQQNIVAANLKPATDGYNLDTLWQAPATLHKNYQLRFELETVTGRKQVYWVPFYR